MSRWRNFQIWRGRLPHWRADGVSYYVTFRHKRPLDETERQELFSALVRQQGKKLDFEILCVLPEVTESIVRVVAEKHGQPAELSDLVEKGKAKAGKAIIKRSGERYPPFYFESYDRIVRDEAEQAEFWERILALAAEEAGSEDPEDYRFIWTSSR